MTLSVEQKKLAEERIKEAGLESRIRVHLLDYRDIPAEFEKAFDAFVSVEMLEVSVLCVASLAQLTTSFSTSEPNITTFTSNSSISPSNPRMPPLLSPRQHSQNLGSPAISE